MRAGDQLPTGRDEREYAYDRDPILGSGTAQILAAAAANQWTVIDMAADWPAVHPPYP
jgi:hypothetical protein